MTTAERLRAEGRAEGRVEGRVEGRAEGEARVLLRLIAKKFGILPAELADTVRAADSRQLEAWTDRILTAATIDELFAS